MKYKIFDWDYCESTRGNTKFTFLKNNWDKPLTEKEFIDTVRSFRATDLKPKKASRYDYGRLKREYGENRPIKNQR